MGLIWKSSFSARSALILPSHLSRFLAYDFLNYFIYSLTPVIIGVAVSRGAHYLWILCGQARVACLSPMQGLFGWHALKVLGFLCCIFYFGAGTAPWKTSPGGHFRERLRQLPWQQLKRGREEVKLGEPTLALALQGQPLEVLQEEVGVDSQGQAEQAGGSSLLARSRTFPLWRHSLKEIHHYLRVFAK